MNIVNKKLSLKEFETYLKTKKFSPNNPNKIVVHHTWKPDVADWKGQTTINGLKKYYEGLGWSNGPHLFISEDGIWLFTNMAIQGIHAGLGNKNSIGIEVVGNYDVKRWTGKTYDNAVGAIKLLMEKIQLEFSDIYFHNQYSSKTCPGTKITKEWLKNQLKSAPVTPPKVELTQTPIIEQSKPPEVKIEPIQEPVVYPTSQKTSITPEQATNPYQADLDEAEKNLTSFWEIIYNLIKKLWTK